MITGIYFFSEDWGTKNKDYYPYEEERRLFYVGLTRTRNNIYIISNRNKESIFINELKKYKNVEIIKKWYNTFWKEGYYG